jgi:hypothetical protein
MLRRFGVKRFGGWYVYGVIFTASVILVALFGWWGVGSMLLAAVGLGWVLFDPQRRAAPLTDVQVETARLLEELPRTFTVFHNVSISELKVDHIVVGPSGVWAIMSLADRGDVEECEDGVRIAGRSMPFDPRRDIGSTAESLVELLRSLTGTPHWVEPLVCLPRATVRTKSSPEDACVVGKRHLLPRLTRKMQRLGAPQSVCVVRALRDMGARPSGGTVASRLRKSGAQPSVASNGKSTPPTGGTAAAPSTRAPSSSGQTPPAGATLVRAVPGRSDASGSLPGYVPSRATTARTPAF